MNKMQEIKSTLPPGSYFFTGNEAAAEGAIAAGCRYYAGYPITPSSEIMERMSQRLKEVSGVFMQMEDEIASICSVVGAAWSGAKSMTATSGPGFSLMQEAIGYGVFTETPLVIVDIQRAGPCTGQATKVGSGDLMQAKWGSHGDYEIIAFSPWSVQEMYDQTIDAFNLSEQYRVPVFVMSDEAVGHLRERMDVGPTVRIINRYKKSGAAPFGTEEKDGVPPMPSFGEGESITVTGSTHNEFGVRKTDDPGVQEKLVGRLNHKILDHRDKIVQSESYYLDDADVIVIAYGFTARSAFFAVDQLRKSGKKAGLLRLKTIWPFADHLIKKVSSQGKKLFVPEMNSGQVYGEIQKYADCEVVPYHQTNGRIIHPKEIIAHIERIL
ncbi:MAG: 2-oxoglutarate synthase subunit alpha [Desulfobacterales bacterium RIFOXYA12_FULL_46_15]|nr:MAG: 2-oxoglutarate synthase subunit alpha [Desulfobacula sp. GWF2_41_7]OGR28475.1 MAG: 2-oxoglutarate synthase subunit alpha [Desulfobacterales bacterium RIFOXYA12_FULL_46_15]